MECTKNRLKSNIWSFFTHYNKGKIKRILTCYYIIYIFTNVCDSFLSFYSSQEHLRLEHMSTKPHFIGKIWASPTHQIQTFFHFHHPETRLRTKIASKLSKIDNRKVRLCHWELLKHKDLIKAKDC